MTLRAGFFFLLTGCTHGVAGRSKGELAPAQEIQSTSASLTVRQALCTAVDGLHYRCQCLCGILRTMAALTGACKGAAASSLLFQLAVQGAPTFPSCLKEALQDAPDRRRIVAGGEEASKQWVTGNGGEAGAPQTGGKHRSHVGRHGPYPMGKKKIRRRTKGAEKSDAGVGESVWSHGTVWSKGFGLVRFGTVR
jgi:hypothetical protein